MKNREILVAVSKKNFLDGSTRSFTTRVRGEEFKGFVVRKGDRYFAYQNLCRHLPVTLDLDDGHFFTHDRNHLQCHMHGAVYEIESGLCIEGPCEGARLHPLTVKEEAGQLVIQIHEPAKS